MPVLVWVCLLIIYCIQALSLVLGIEPKIYQPRALDLWPLSMVTKTTLPKVTLVYG